LKILVTIAGRSRTVELSRRDAHPVFTIDGREMNADAVAIAPTLYSVLLDGRSFESHVRKAPAGGLVVTIDGQEFPVTIEDPRQWQRHRTGSVEAEGRQQVIASMPGKVVRLLTAAGQQVQAGQGLLVLEAMKMQNEVRSPKSGVVERLLVREGQTVNAGEPLAVVG
jgi:biotin carboxyl carrier protein